MIILGYRAAGDGWDVRIEVTGAYADGTSRIDTLHVRRSDLPADPSLEDVQAAVWALTQDDPLGVALGANVAPANPDAALAQAATRRALSDYQQLADFHAGLVTGGQTEWDAVAPAAGLPAGAAAFNAATAFTLARRRAAQARALRALNRWRLVHN